MGFHSENSSQVNDIKISTEEIPQPGGTWDFSIEETKEVTEIISSLYSMKQKW